MDNNQIIAVCGNPSCGKTITSIKLARELSLKKKNVIIVFTDLLSPAIMTVLPHAKLENKSLGNLLSASEITQEDILSKCITLDKNQYISLLGYLQGENTFTYAEYSKERAVDLLILLRHLADYVIVDCSSLFVYDILSATALEMADKVIRLCSANLKAAAYFSSYLPLLTDKKFNLDMHIKVLSDTKDNEPKEQIKQMYRGVQYEIPHIEEIENQLLNGELFNELKLKSSKKYIKIIKELDQALIDEDAAVKKKSVKEKAAARKIKVNEISLFEKILSIGKGGTSL